MLFRILVVLSIVLFPGSLFAGQAGAEGPTETIQYGRFNYSIGPEPAWVDPLPLPAGKDAPPQGQGVQYLLEDRQVRIGSRKREVYQRHVRALTSHQGVLSESELQIDFNPDYQHLILHKVQVVREGEIIDRLANAEIKLLQREQQIPVGIFTGEVSAVVILKDIRVGDRLEYSYTVNGQNPVFGDKAFGSASVGWGVEVGRVRVRVLAPRARKLRTAAYNTSIVMQERPGGEYLEYLWQQDNTPVVNDEGDYPHWYTPYPWIEYTEYASWGEVEKWAQELYLAGNDQHGEFVRLVDRLKKESRDEEDYIRRALLFVQEEIRYLGMEIGENSHRPHAPGEVIAHRYGDCKDKAQLLVTLLNARGIEAYPAMVSHGFRSGVKDCLPNPGCFDHVIVVAKHKKQLLWLDGTRSYQRGDLNRLGFVPYGVALVVGDDTLAPLVNVEPLPGQIDKIEVTEHFQVEDFDGDVRLTVVSVTTGGMAEYQRRLFANDNTTEITKNYLNFYVRRYPGIESAGAIEFFDNEKENVFKTVESYLIKNFWTKEDVQYLISNYYSSTIKNFTPFPKTLKRSMPLYLGDPVEVSHRIRVDFPDDVNLRISSEPVIFKDQSSYYESVSSYSDQRFETVSRYDLLQSWVDTPKVDEHLANLRKISNDIDFSLTFRWPPKPDEETLYQRLLSRLAEIRKTKKLEGGKP